LIAVAALSVAVYSLEEEGEFIRPKRQHFLGVIIESALTGQHHGFGTYK
jgi:hypothetical protein